MDAIVPGWPGSPFLALGFLPAVMLLLVVISLFILMARAAANDGGSMEKTNRIRQWYGYTVCLIALVIGLGCFAGLLDNAFDLSNPLASQFGYETSLTSFEAYKATRGQRFVPPDQRSAPDTASDATLRVRYEALRADRIASRSFDARKGLVKDLLLLLFAIGLFVWHWRWLRRMPDGEPTGRAA